MSGFGELLEDVAASTNRPIVSVSTNGTLIGEGWAERIVRTPFLNLTFSIDAATPATYARLRRGGRLEDALGGLAHVQAWKQRLGRGAAAHRLVLRDHAVEFSRDPRIPGTAGRPRDPQRLYANRGDQRRERRARARRTARGRQGSCGTPFDPARGHGWEGQPCHPAVRGPKPVRESRPGRVVPRRGRGTASGTRGRRGWRSPVCVPNPWTTLFLDQTGAAYLCFLSEPVGNIFETPLERVWNGPEAVAKRTWMLSGRYIAFRLRRGLLRVERGASPNAGLTRGGARSASRDGRAAPPPARGPPVARARGDFGPACRAAASASEPPACRGVAGSARSDGGTARGR